MYNIVYIYTITHFVYILHINIFYIYIYLYRKHLNWKVEFRQLEDYSCLNSSVLIRWLQYKIYRLYSEASSERNPTQTRICKRVIFPTASFLLQIPDSLP